MLKKLKSLFAPAGDGRSYWFYVRCEKCGEVLRGRADLMNDLSPQYEGGSLSYFCRKVLVGSQGCYAPIEVKLYFDKNRKPVSREISGGEFVTEAEYAPSSKDPKGLRDL